MKKRIEGIQVLRIAAALMVVLDHALLKLVDGGLLPDWMEAPAFRAGHVGVAIFFAVSGFVMAHVGTGSRGVGGAGNFMLRRIVRIVPLYWIATLAHLANQGLRGEPVALADVLKSLAFIPYFDAEGLLRPVLGLGWTLNYEMGFYLLFAASLLLPARAAFWVLTMGLAGAFGLARFQQEAAGPLWAFLANPMLLLFPGGMLAHALYRRIGERSLSGRLAMGLCAGLVALSLVPGWTSYALAPAIVLVAALAPERIPRQLSPSGEASYAIYLTHGFVLGPLAAWLVVPGAPPLLFLAAALVFALVVGGAFHVVVERPLLAALRTRLRLEKGAEGATTRFPSRQAWYSAGSVK